MAQKKQSRKRSATRPAVPKKAATKKAATKVPAREPAAGGKKRAGRKKAGTAGKGAPPPAQDPNDPVAQIQRVIDVMVAAGAVEVELENAGSKLRVRLNSDIPVPVVSYPAAGAPAAVAPVVAAAAPLESMMPGAVPAAGHDDPKRFVFHSPMVGTFYRAAAPDADPYVEVGDRVEADTTLCILEAMKVMNEIKAETSGEIVEILAQNGEPVEFGQPLFVIRVD